MQLKLINKEKEKVFLTKISFVELVVGENVLDNVTPRRKSFIEEEIKERKLKITLEEMVEKQRDKDELQTEDKKE